MDAADVVQIVVADPPAVRALLARIAPALGHGKVVVQSSTIDPAATGTARLVPPAALRSAASPAPRG